MRWFSDDKKEMEARIEVPIECIDFITCLEGFESLCVYHYPGHVSKELEWGRVRHDDLMIYFDIIPNKQERARNEPKAFNNIKKERGQRR